MGIKRWFDQLLWQANRDDSPRVSMFGAGAERARRVERAADDFDLEVERNRPKLGF